MHFQAFGECAGAQNLDAVPFLALDQSSGTQAFFVDDRVRIEPGLENGQIDDRIGLLEGAIHESALGHAARKGHLAPLEDGAELEPLPGCVALVTLARSLAVAGADAP